MRWTLHVAWKRCEIHAKFVRKPDENTPLGRPEWNDNIKMFLKDVGWRMWTRFIRLRIGTGGRFL
jgi:hypothetical protein